MADKSGVSRRGFLKAVGAGGGVVAGKGLLSPTSERTPGAPVFGPGKVAFSLTVDGRKRELRVEPRTTLLNALRTHLDVTGPKEGCDRGACGACTVWKDGKPVVACLTLAVDCANREVTTVAGVGGRKTSLLQKKFVEKEGLQCGFCIPGFIMSIQAVLRDRPKATLDEIRAGCSGNICRCAAYPGMFAAALAAVQGEPPEADYGKLGGADLKKVLEEKGIPRIDGEEKVTGRARYTTDIKLPGMLYAKLLNSPFARAEVVGKPNLDAAKKVPGIRDVRVLNERPASIGAPVAIAIAEDPQAADEALGALAVRLRPFPVAVDPIGHFRKGEVREHRNSRRRRADLRSGGTTVERTYVVNMVQHSALEPHGCTARWDEKGVTIFESTQHVTGVQRAIARATELPQGRVRAVTEHMGGGFGAKIGPWRFSPDVVRLSKELGAPIQCMNTRAGELLAGGGRIPNVVQVKLGAGKDGVLVGEWRKAWPRLMGPYWYRVPTACDRVFSSMEGIGPTPALRAPGDPPKAFVMESVMDDLAAELGMDPLAFRLKNMPRYHREMERWFEEGARRIGWDRRPKTPGADKGPRPRGIGVGCGQFAGSKGCNFIEVEVDRETGVVDVKKVVVVFQGGFINRRAVLNQVYGGTIMGLSWARFEERILDPKTGAMLNPNLEFYRIAGPMDVPEIEIVLLGEEGVSRGVGEAPVVPPAGALSNAVFNALGVRVARMPFTPKYVLDALEG